MQRGARVPASPGLYPVPPTSLWASPHPPWFLPLPPCPLPYCSIAKEVEAGRLRMRQFKGGMDRKTAGHPTGPPTGSRKEE